MITWSAREHLETSSTSLTDTSLRNNCKTFTAVYMASVSRASLCHTWGRSPCQSWVETARTSRKVGCSLCVARYFVFHRDICVTARILFPTAPSLAPLPSRRIFMLMAALPSLPIMRDEQVAPCRWQANPYKDFTSLRNPFNVASRLINRPNPNPAWCQVWCSDLTRGRRNVPVVCSHVNTGLFCGGHIVGSQRLSV